jgi:hypothetical protein
LNELNEAFLPGIKTVFPTSDKVQRCYTIDGGDQTRYFIIIARVQLAVGRSWYEYNDIRWQLGTLSINLGMTHLVQPDRKIMEDAKKKREIDMLSNDHELM